MKFNSHPNKLLVNHLIQVKNLSINKAPKDVKRSYEIVALCHDFGKYTSYFQDYLKNSQKTDLSNHGFISAVFGAFVALNELGEDSYLPLIIYSSILHHHGNLINFGENLPNRIKNPKITDFTVKLLNKIEICEKQIHNIKANKGYMVDDFQLLGLSNELELFLLEEDIINNTLVKLKRIQLRLSLLENQEEYYFMHQNIYSALISADKISASGCVYDAPLFIGFNKLKNMKKEFFKGKKSSLNDIREDIFSKVLSNLEAKYDKSRIFSITSPTGTGKTYTGFYTAVRLKELLNLDGKIIYSLPFTSIIEQNYSSIVDILNNEDDFHSNKGRYIIKHHNLSKTSYESEFYDYSNTQAELLIENWESGVIVTTFVQLFETIVGSRNRMLKKFISFNNSVILIDELQSVDIGYYKLVEYVLEKLTAHVNCKIIIMTATKPMILENAMELLPDNEKYFKIFNRTFLVPKLQKLSISNFIDDFIERIKDKSYLIVCNTINQSIEVYDALKVLDRCVYYLSTNILPLRRKEILEKVKTSLKNDEKIILISTQVVEAGVDVDFDEVIRDLAPLDSIIQCAGRCNRNASKADGRVTIVNMVKENGDSYAKSIYGNTLLNLTQELLVDKDIIYEREYFEIINKYYHLVKLNKSQDSSDKFIKAINNINFSDDEWAISKFSLIKDNPGYIDVLFLYDEVAEDAYEEYKNILKVKNFEEKRERYLEIGQVLKNYTLSIPLKYCRTFVPEFGMLVLPREGIGQYYDENTGFIRNDNETYLIF